MEKYFRSKLLSVACLISVLAGSVNLARAQYYSIPEPDMQVMNERQAIMQKFQKLQDENRFTDYLDLGQTIEFPIGIRKSIGGLEYTIAIDSVVLTPNYAFLNASMLFKPPQSDEHIAFRGTDIRFTQEGGISGVAKLQLVGDYYINGPSSQLSLLLRGDDTTVEWDCDGFNSFQLSGGLIFSRDLLIPVNENLEQIPEARVIADFSVNIGDWNDLVATAKITPFQIPGLNGFSFFIGEIMVDFSDHRNPTGAIFSSAYESRFLVPGMRELWRGVYLNQLELVLPEQFNKSEEPTKIFASKLWIDEFGLSGLIRGENILSLADGGGSMGGWPFSVDKFSLGLLAGELTSASFGGQVLLPITDQNSAIRYDAFIDSKNDYFFNITATDSLTFDLWQADVEIYESSFINVEVVNGKFKPTAILNGKMDINTPAGELPKFQLPDLAFQQLKLVDKPPFIEGGIFSPESVTRMPELGSFKLDLKEIGLRKVSDEEIALDISAGIILNGQGGGALAADGGLAIIGKVVTGEHRKKIQFSDLKVKEAKIDIDNGAYNFTGMIAHYHNQPTFGSGFMGLIDAEFKPGIGVKAKAMFGKVNDYNYWYADALAKFTPAIAIAPGLGIYGFGGGASYHMVRRNLPQSQYSQSGLEYLPDNETGLNIRAAVNLGSLPDQSAFTGFASFELSFYNNGGLKNLNFRGEASFMAPKILDNGSDMIKEKVSLMSGYPTNEAQPDDLYRQGSQDNHSQISGDVNINFDFANRILHGNFQVFVNTPGGIIRGTGEYGRAGWAVMHFAPSDWYVHIGTPQNRLGLRMGIGQIAATTNAYFMAGNHLPAPPLPNENVSAILGGIDLNYMRDESSLASGKGFALGAALEFSTGDLEFWKFYAKFSAGAGFDIMLKDYGNEAACANRSGTLGLNGWYANGQAYAYFDGKIGILVDLFNKPQRFDIINLSAAAVLQAKLPNPFWMRGIVGGNFSILNGLVSGKCRFQVTLGEECDLSNTSAVSGLTVIADISPDSEMQEVNVFTNPQVVFNLPVHKEFELIDPDNQKKKFRIKLDHFRVRNDEGLISGDVEWNEPGDVAIFKPLEILPSVTTLTIEAQVSYEENKNGNWRPVIANGNKIIENRQSTFVTGTAPDFIPLENVAFAYPTPGMKNLLPEESEIAYIQLIKGQSYLFEDEAYQNVGVIQSSDHKVSFEYDYDAVNRKLSYIIPDINTSMNYRIEILRRKLVTNNKMDDNVITVQTGVDGSTDVSINSKEADGIVQSDDELNIFSNSFSTSIYKTFPEKMAGVSWRYVYRDQLVDWDVHRLEAGLLLPENFTEEEMAGNQYTDNQPLIWKQALTENSYFTTKVNPLVYNNYPIDGVATITERDVNELGIIPLKAINLNNTLLQYDLPIIYRQDFAEIRNKVIPLYIHDPGPLPEQVQKLLFYSFPIVPQGNYGIKFNYFLPGSSTPNSSYVLDLNLDFNN